MQSLRTHRSLKAVIALCASVLSVGLAQDGMAQTAAKVRVDIPAQDLSTALTQFGRETGTEIVFAPDAVRGKKADAVQGEFEREQALSLLLRGSGLTYRVTTQGAVVVETARTGADASRAAALRLAQNMSSTENAESRSSQSAIETSGDQKPLPASSDADASRLGEIVVTGTHIRGARPVGSELNIYSREDIERQGASRMEDFLARVPQNHSSVSSLAAGRGPGALVSNEGTMAASEPNLRGLGAGSTLTLLNGMRLTQSGAITTGTDVSFIPISALERVEMLSDGASSIYGADAVGGVVNFRLRRDFSGFETSGRYEDTTRGGGARWSATQLAGSSWTSGDGLLVYQHDKQEPLFARQRDFVTPGPMRPTQLLTSSGQDSAIGHIAQDFGAMRLDGVGYYGERDATSDASSLFRQLLSSQIEQYGAALALSRSFGAWSARLEGNSSRNRNDAMSVYPDFDLTTTTRTRQSSNEAALRLDGPLFSLGDRTVQASFGTSYRREKDSYENLASADRNVRSAYGELLIPILRNEGRAPFARELTLSVSARHDAYSDVGSATSPRAGVNWNLSNGVSLRGSWSQAFRAPYLQQLHGPLTYIVYSIADPTADDGFTNTIIDLSQAVPELKPERSTNLSLGIDLLLPSTPELKASLTYFRIRYRDRIQRPPLLGIDPSIDLYQPFNTDLAAPFLDRSPDPARVAQIFAVTPPNFILDFSGAGPAGVEAIFDFRDANLALDETDGLDLSIAYSTAAAGGDVSATVGGSYLFDLQRRALSAAPTVSFVDTVYNPVGLKVFLNAAWTRGPLSMGLGLNYIDSYRNPFSVPQRDIPSWTTADFNISYDLAQRRAGPLAFKLSAFVRNLTDRAPPFIGNFGTTYSVGYDETNANPLGRTIAVQLTSRW